MFVDEDIFRGIGVEIILPIDREAGELSERKRAAFLKIAETLTRIGTIDEDDKTVLWQSCYILHKKGRYVIAHESELRWLDGEPVQATAQDVAVRNRVADLLEAWELADLLIEDDEELSPMAPVSDLKIIAFRDKKNWNLKSGYAIGKRASAAHRQPTSQEVVTVV